MCDRGAPVGLHRASHFSNGALRGDTENLETPKDDDACTSVATPTAAASGQSSDPSRVGMTLSSSCFDDHGNTKPAARLIIISTKPMASRRRCSQSSSRASRRPLRW